MGANRILAGDVKKNILKVLEVISSVVFSIIVIVCALYAAGIMFDLYKGRNYSDVGVPMYTNSFGALLLALITYLGIIIIVPVGIWMTLKSRIFLYIYCVINFFIFILVLGFFMMLLA
jgi:hypothetical protein